MGHRDNPLIPSRERQARRSREMTIIHAVMACLILVIILQFFLLMVAVEEFQGARREILLPAAIASAACFAGACWLIRPLAAARARASRPP